MKNPGNLKNLRFIAGLLFLACFTAASLGWKPASELLHLQLGPMSVRLLASFSWGLLTALGTVFFLTLLFGRLYCSVFCPLGILQELLGRGLQEVLGPSKTDLRTTRSFKWIRYPLLALIVTLALAGTLFPATWLLPSSNYVMMLNHLGTPESGAFFAAWGFLILLIVLVRLRGRIYCNSFCPVGALLSLISRFAIFRIRVRKNCVHCGMCEKKCPAGCLDPKTGRVNASECLVCLECLMECRVNALTYAPPFLGKEQGKEQTCRGVCLPQEEIARSKDVPTQDVPTQDVPTQDVPTQDAPTQDVPTQDVPTQDAPTQDVPTQDAPTQDAPTQDAPTQDAPTQDAPTQDAPTQDVPEKDVPEKDVPEKDVPEKETVETVHSPSASAQGPDLIRRALLISSATAAGAGVGHFLNLRNVRKPDELKADTERQVLPPGAWSYEKFRTRCVGCGLCVGVCQGNVISLSMGQHGLYGTLQPFLNFEQGKCLPDCDACMKICPTGALEDLGLEIKKKLRLGIGSYDPLGCRAFLGTHPCAKCEQACPQKAISMVEFRGRKIPKFNDDLCTGCGACQLVCPKNVMRVIPAVEQTVLEITETETKSEEKEGENA